MSFKESGNVINNQLKDVSKMLAKQGKIAYFRDFLKLNEEIGSAYRIRIDSKTVGYINLASPLL